MRQPSTPREEDDSEAVVKENVSDKSTSVMMLEILETVQGNQAHLRTIEQSLAFVHSELDAQKAETNQLKSENEELKARLDRVEKRCDVLEEDLRIQSKMRDENEQNSRMVNLEISGVPQLPGETDTDCKKIAGEVMKLVGSRYAEADVDDAHRKFAGGLIVRFMSRTVRNEVYLKRFALVGKKAQDVAPRFRGVEGAEEDLYINENLSYDRLKLMKYCRDKIKPMNVCVSKEGILKTKSLRGNVFVQNSPQKHVFLDFLGLAKYFDIFGFNFEFSTPKC